MQISWSYPVETDAACFLFTALHFSSIGSALICILFEVFRQKIIMIDEITNVPFLDLQRKKCEDNNIPAYILALPIEAHKSMVIIDLMDLHDFSSLGTTTEDLLEFRVESFKFVLLIFWSGF